MSVEILFTARFIRYYNNLSKKLQVEVKEKLALFSSDPNNPLLKVHKLKGEMKGMHAFSVNYQIRVIFKFLGKENEQIVCLAVGSHDLYS